MIHLFRALKQPDAVTNTVDKLPVDKQSTERAALDKWFSYGEYIMIEIDTDNGTARVIPNSEKAEKNQVKK